MLESEDQLTIQVGVLEGELQREVVVCFSISDKTAIGKLNKSFNHMYFIMFMCNFRWK